MDGCIQGELHDDDQKSLHGVAGVLGSSVKIWGGSLASCGRVWDQFFLNRDESLVRLAKAFARERHVSCVWIRIIDVGKAICRSEDTHMLLYW